MLHQLRRGGFEVIAQGMGGIIYVTGEPDDPPTSVGLPICDLGTGMRAVQGTPEGVLQAPPLLERSLALEPDYTLAHGHAGGLP
jgi:hypothetical protein